jgi:hypothetical protein
MAFPGIHNFTYYRGDTHQFEVVLKTANNEDFPLADYESIVFKIAPRRGVADGQITGTAEVKSGTTNTILCTIPANVGKNMVPPRYVYDIQITDTSAVPDIVYTVLTGDITVLNDISQPLSE